MFSAYTSPTATANGGNSVASSCRIHSPAIATPALRPSMELALRPNDQKPAIVMPLATTLSLPASTDHTQSTTKAMLVLPLPKSKSVDTVDGDTSGRSATKPDSTDPLFRTFRLAENPMAAAVPTTHTPGMMIPERDTTNITNNIPKTPMNLRLMPHRPIAGPAKLTIQSTPVKSQPPMLSSNLSSQNKGQQAIVATPTTAGNRSSAAMVVAAKTENPDPLFRTFRLTATAHNHVRECHSSSDENRSSGHASMSDTGHGSSSPGCGNSHNRGNATKLGTTGFWNASEHIARKNSQDVRKQSLGTRCNESRSRHKVPWNGTGLEDVKLAIQQLTMRSQTSTSTYSSLSAGSESSEPVRRLGRYSSLETVNTNVTSADE